MAPARNAAHRERSPGSGMDSRLCLPYRPRQIRDHAPAKKQQELSRSETTRKGDDGALLFTVLNKGLGDRTYSGIKSGR